MPRIASLAGLASLGLSVLASALPGSVGHAERWQPEGYLGNALDKRAVCKKARNTDIAEEIWSKVGAVKVLEDWIEDHNDGTQEQWLAEYESWVMEKDGQLEVHSAACKGFVEQGVCDIRDKCYYFESAAKKKCKTPKEAKYVETGYWIFNAIQGMHEKLSNIYNEIGDSTMFNMLKLDEMEDNLGASGGDDNGNVLAWLAAGSTMVAGAAVKADPVAGGATFLAGLFAAMAIEEDDNDKFRGKLTSAMADSIVAGRARLERLMAGATGHNKYAFAELPNWAGSKAKTQIGRFLDNPFWILEVNAEGENGKAGPMRKLLRRLRGNIRAKITNKMVHNAKWVVYVDRRKDTEKCKAKIKVEDETICAFLAKDRHGIAQGSKFTMADDKYWGIMGDYGIKDPKVYMESVVDCIRKGRGDSEMDMEELLKNEGGVPRCFFTGKAYYIDDDPDKVNKCDPGTQCKPKGGYKFNRIHRNV